MPLNFFAINLILHKELSVPGALGLGKMNKHSPYFLKANNSTLETREFPTSRIAVEVSIFVQSNRTPLKEPQSEAQRISRRLENQPGDWNLGKSSGWEIGSWQRSWAKGSKTRTAQPLLNTMEDCECAWLSRGLVFHSSTSRNRWEHLAGWARAVCPHCGGRGLRATPAHPCHMQWGTFQSDRDKDAGNAHSPGQQRNHSSLGRSHCFLLSGEPQRQTVFIFFILSLFPMTRFSNLPVVRSRISRSTTSQLSLRFK